MDSTRRQTLNALREMFPTAVRIDVDVQLTLHQNGVFEELWALMITGVTPRPVQVAGPTLQDVMGQILAKMATMARPTDESLRCLARLSLN